MLNWVKHNLPERQKHIYELMSHVRLPLVGRDFLMSCVDSETLIRDDPGCKELLLEAMKYHLLPEQRSLMTTKRTSERRPDGMKPYVFAVGELIVFFFLIACISLVDQLNTFIVY